MIQSKPWTSGGSFTSTLALVAALAGCGGGAGGATGEAGTSATGVAGASATGAAGHGTAGTSATGAAGTSAMGAAGTSTTGAAGTGAAGVSAAGAAGLGAAGSNGAAGTAVMGSLTFTRKTLHLFNYAEAAGIGDFNKDGKADVHSGPFWWEGPAFDKKHQYFPPPANNAYTNQTLGDWADYQLDVDGDGWLDSINVMRPGEASYWYKNPGAPGNAADVATWEKHGVGTLVLEQSMFTDLVGDGKPNLVCAIDMQFGFFDPSTKEPWTFSRIGPSGATNAYAWWHGIGTGDLDGDGKQDLITDSAWYTRPAGDPRASAWTSHPQRFKGDGVAAEHGPSHMYGYDVDGDGDDDVITSLDSHGYGLAWYENKKGSFTEHVIVGGAGSMAMNAGMIAPFSQPHALVVADVDGDGLKDIITGKSFYAHPPGMGDPDVDGTPIFYVFKLVRAAQGPTFEPHVVDREVGLGRQFAVGDMNGDGKVDIAVGSKHGAFLFFQQ